MVSMVNDSRHPAALSPEGAAATGITVSLGTKPSEELELGEGVTVARFRILGPLGRGGMGHVFRAHDPKLGREVALKLLRHSTDARAQEWLRREAQAMASLNHPNVVAIYDVGRATLVPGRSTLFIAMELIEGETVKQWLRSQTRSLHEIMAVFVEAGRGLVAAHRAGLIHRDFKPSNLLIGRDGRVRVLDFGIARVFERSTGYYEPWAHVELHHDLSQTGEVVGTPAYMAPEQHRGQTFDERCDQYAFCVALWEALHGRRPFEAASLAALLAAKHAHMPKASRSLRSGVPGWLEAIVRRGLSPKPADRFDSMAELLAALEHEWKRAHRWRRVMLGSTGVAIAALLTGLAVMLEPNPSPCDTTHPSLEGVWDPPTRARIERALRERVADGDGVEAWARIEPTLDAYATRWNAAHAGVCNELGREPHGLVAVDDGRLRCLDERQSHLRTLVEELERADPAVVREAVVLAGRLPALDDCRDRRERDDDPPLPEDPELRARVFGARQQLARAKLLEIAGNFEEGLSLAEAAWATSRAVGYEPLRAEAALRVGALLEHVDRFPEAADAMEEAYFVASSEGYDAVRADAAVWLVLIVGKDLGEVQRVEPWIRHAETEVERSNDPQLRAALHHHLGDVFVSRHFPEEALASYQRAIEVLEPAVDPRDPTLALYLDDLGRAHKALGQLDLAMACYRRALSICEQRLGQRHPLTALTLHNIGFVHYLQRRPDDAMAHYERALAILEAVFDGPNQNIANAHYVIGHVHSDRGDHEQALASYTRAHSIWEQALGPSHPESLVGLDAMAQAHKNMGRYEEALEVLRRGTFLREQGLDPLHPDFAKSLEFMGDILVELGELDEALEAYERTLLVQEQVFGNPALQMSNVLYNISDVHTRLGRHEDAVPPLQRALALIEQDLGLHTPRVVFLLARLGQALMNAGRGDEALEVLERALSLCDPPQGVVDCAEAGFLLAQALGVGQAEERALALAERSREQYLACSADHRETIDRIERWIRTHRR
jgi:tetratricopeptide (TPR) repeat protein/predicted Ser/Thr protein kinase